MEWVYFGLFFFSWGLSLLLVPLMIRLAHRFNFLDQPNERKIHRDPHPLLGGAAIFFSFQITILLTLAVVWAIWHFPIKSTSDFFQDISRLVLIHYPGIQSKQGELWLLLGGGIVCFIGGLYDDRFRISPKTKLLIEFIAALIVVSAGIKFDVFQNIPYMGALITIFWIVFITNAFNLLDNMDGLSAGVASISLFFFIIVTFQMDQIFLVCIMVVLLGSILGFLPYNINPSKIFMGDAGSLFIGYTIGALTVFSTFYDSISPTPLSITKPLVILAVPLFDTLSVIAIRLKRGLPIFQGDKNHFSHRLVAIGMSHKNAVFFIYLVTLSTGMGATLFRLLPFYGAIIILTQIILVFAIIVLLERIRQ